MVFEVKITENREKNASKNAFLLACISIDFKRVWGGQNGPQIEIFGIFLDMLVQTLFLVEFCLIFDKIDD